ncbi:MAG: hypothetical protein KDC44_15955, partial [Phaeodactylibacter sp.]|nr:hypothetical protein [Phaeodactylibacter sp.]
QFQAKLGRQAQIRVYDRSLQTPMNFLLAHLTQYLGDTFSLYWADNGVAELPVVEAEGKHHLVFSPRYLSMTAHIRNILVAEHSFNARVEFTARAALQLIGELALQHGAADFAGLAFARAVVGRKPEMAWGRNAQADLMALERTPINEGYMSIWYYGLLQAFGAYSPLQQQEFEQTSYLSNSGLLQQLSTAVNDMGFEQQLRQEVIVKAHEQQGVSQVQLRALRQKALCDIFAFSVLLDATVDIMKQLNKQAFNMLQFIQEVLMAHQVVGLVEQCQALATLSQYETLKEQERLESILHPAAIRARALIQREYMRFRITQYLYGEKPSVEEQAAVDKAIQKAADYFDPRVHALLVGVHTAREFLLYPNNRPAAKVVLDQLKTQLNEKGNTDRETLVAFSARADAMGKDSSFLRELRALVG